MLCYTYKPAYVKKVKACCYHTAEVVEYFLGKLHCSANVWKKNTMKTVKFLTSVLKCRNKVNRIST